MPAPAYSDISATIPPNIFQAFLDPGATGGVGLNLPKFQYPGIPALNYQKGTGAQQINILGVKGGTLAAGTVAIDLTTITDVFGTALNFATVLGFVVLNYATTASNILLVDGTVANAWKAPYNAIATAKLVVPAGALVGTTTVPGFIMMASPNTAGYAVSGTSKVIQLDSGAFTIPYQVAAIGISA
jgi:hypothetical protein